MATNPYFTSNFTATTQEQVLVDSLTIEFIKMYGWDYYYVPRTLVNPDFLFGEDQLSKFQSAYPVEMYLENVNSFGQDGGNLLSKFGLEIRSEAYLICSIRRFEEEVTANQPTITRPREGDVLFFDDPVDRRRRAYEITFVDNESQFYSVGRLYSYRITVKNFEYSGETFDTGIDEIDSYTNTNSLTMDIQVAVGGGTYIVGERVSQIGGFAADVVSFEDNLLVLNNYKGEFEQSLPIIGDVSGCTRSVVDIEDTVGNDSSLNDNIEIEERVIDTGLVDNSESNPLLG